MSQWEEWQSQIVTGSMLDVRYYYGHFFGKYNQPHKRKDIQLVLGLDGEVVFEGSQWELGC